MKNDLKLGMKAGIPICLGYLSVSFGFGILAVKMGLPAWVAVLISATNLTSAGQVAGVGVIAASGPYIEMILTQVLINLRYSLMGISLSQKLSDDFSTPHRILASFGITDEVFGVSSAREKEVTPAYMYGMIIVAFAGWVMGTFLGALSGELLPKVLVNALGIMLYGMFIAIIIPPIKERSANLAVILIAAAISCCLYYFVPGISNGFSIIISAVIAAGIMAKIAPVKEVE